ncbi:DUF2783 domain-containing protein [Salaquimonas pukyongi]|uniref:DUF2783 domain-containing protein n=1 Tax=Salaquimonas pukyongi TaxID=2712698 RepID=UPI00096BBBCF|nr:DUF2783 domain-containing protein [Salaquimonas pukyongi]
MSGLTLEPNLANADDFYAALLAAHEGRSKEESDALNARLVLILANHVGDEDVLVQALEAAVRQSGGKS